MKTHRKGCRCKTKPGTVPPEPLKKLNLKGPKVSRRKIGSPPRQNIWRQMQKQAAKEIMEAEDKEWFRLVERYMEFA